MKLTKKNVLIQTDFIDDMGSRKEYTVHNANEDIKCYVDYLTKNSIIKHITKCSDNNKYIAIYSNASSSLIETLHYKNNKLKTRVSIKYGECKEYSNSNLLVSKYECYPYEETRPVTLRE